MSRKKDRQHFQQRKQLDPGYKGFRDSAQEPKAATWATLVSVTCRVCGHRRNIPANEAPEDGAGYVCLRCREDEG